MDDAAKADIRRVPTLGDGVQDRDYQMVRRAVSYLREHAAQSSEATRLGGLARHLGISPSHCQRLFKRWCGLSPKEFSAAIAIDHARGLLKRNASVLETAHASGLSGAGRLHDLFVTHEAMTPGDYKRRGEGIAMGWGAHLTPFGIAVAVATERGLAGLAFVDEDKGQTADDALCDLMKRWPRARCNEAPDVTRTYIERIFDPSRWSPSEPVRLVMIGTEWEVKVWQALLRIPMGHAASYRDIAERVCTARAARAVGMAVGRNPLSFVVPCHRVLRSDGGLGGYHWGVTRKLALIGWEAGRVACGPEA
ncbi:MAG: methylated-DNA--[protein]-cysteine S-methyltransferase [Alphaproteobacteria bacterium]|nr:methylated-DNA--[protein]-cysteine S-methyltransferase [Alphaproteobacteria bacterium]